MCACAAPADDRLAPVQVTLVAAWRERLAPYGVTAERLSDAVFTQDGEPGITPDGRLSLPDAWRTSPDDALVLARIAHLVRHDTLGMPSRDDAACVVWELRMLASELDGLAIETRVRADLLAPMPPDAIVKHLDERIDAYHRRCLDDAR